MKLSVRLKFGAFALVSLAVLLVLYNTMANRVSGESREYRADFTSASGLRIGDDVRAAGVRVGRVQAIELVEGDTARVRFVVGDGQQLTDTTRITVRYQNLLGQRYLALMPGEEVGTPVDPDDVVPPDQTDPGFDLTALLNGFEPLFEALDPEQVNQLATSLVAVLQGEGGTVENLLAQTGALTQDLAAKDEVFGQVLDRLTPVLQEFAAHDAELGATVDELAALMDGLAAERATIGASIDSMSSLAEATSALAAAARPDAASTVTSLRTVADALVAHQDTLNQLFAMIPTGTGAFTRPTNTGTWLNMYICAMSIQMLDDLVIDLGNPDGPFSEVCS